MNILPQIDNFRTKPNSILDAEHTITLDDWCLALNYMETIGGSFTHDGIIRIMKDSDLPSDSILNKKLLIPKNFTCTERIVLRNLKIVELPEDLTITGVGLILFDTFSFSKLDLNKIKYIYIEISGDQPDYDLEKIDNFIMEHYGPKAEKEFLGSLITYTILS